MANVILPTLLLVEDNPDDQRFFLWAAKKGKLPLRVSLATDGEQAIGLLSRFPERLFLILSDVHLPRRSGWDVLGWVRRQPLYLSLPFILWTSMADPDGARRALELGASSYVSKPIHLVDYRGLLTIIEGYLPATRPA
jgi:CheY-like chemotaxis protein